MSLTNQIIVVCNCFLISLVYIRAFLYGVKRYQLNNSAYKKRKKGETFKEWIFYSRYKEEIPKILRVLYYFVLLIHPIGLFTCLFVNIIDLSLNIGGIFATAIVIFDVVWILAIALLFWNPGPDYAYERWIRKNRGKKRNKK